MLEGEGEEGWEEEEAVAATVAAATVVVEGCAADVSKMKARANVTN